MKKIYAISVLALVQFIMINEMSIVMPLAPKIAEYYSVNPNRVTFLNTGYALMGLLTPLLGFSAEKIGIKKILLFTVGLFSIGSFLTANSETALQFFLSRSLIGLGYFTLASLIISYTSKIIPYDKLGFSSGVYKLSFAIAVFTSPIIGNIFVTNCSISELYYTFGISMLLVFFLLIPLPKIDSEEGIDFKEFKRLIVNKEVKTMMLITFLTSIPAVYFYNYMSLFLSSKGYDQLFITVVYSTVALGTLGAAIIIILFSDRIGKLRLTKYGFMASVIVILPIFMNSPVIIISFIFLFGFTFDTVWGLLFPVGSKMFKKESNSFLTLLGMSMALANTFSNITAPYVNDLGGFFLNIIVCSVSILVAGILFIKVTKGYQSELN
ncbi:MFS transporter [Mycoplasmatota bacterium zrk1]